MDPECHNHHRDILPPFFPGDCVMAVAPGTDIHQFHHHHQSEPQGPAMFQFSNSSSSSSSQSAPGNSQLDQMDGGQQYSPQPHLSLQSQAQINLDMLGDLLPMSIPGMDLNSPQDSNSNQAGVGGQLGYIPHVFVDHHLRLSQLQQLQQLQQQIFQQQIAILSSQTPSLLNGAPTFDSQRDQSLIFNGIPTPVSSGQLRPQQQSLDIIAPMALNSLGDSVSRGHSSGPSLPNSPTTLHSAPGSVTSSPTFLASHSSSSTFSTAPYVSAGSVSAPEHIAFQNRGPPPANDFDLDISPLTSPWLGAQPNQSVLPLSNQPQNKGQSWQNQKCTYQQSYHRSSASSSPSPSQGGHQCPSTPVTGSIPMSNIITNPNINNKRSASPSSAEADARKRHSPAVRPTNPGGFSPYLDQQPTTRRSTRSSTRSASTSSTPLLRARSASNRQRKGSIATPVVNEVLGDSPSPVDLSMPPPAPPISHNSTLTGSSIGSMSSPPAFTPLTPVTPSSIMNIDMKGKRMKTTTDTPAGVSQTSPVTSRSKRGAIQGNAPTGSLLISPSLKPILPSPSNIHPMGPASAATSAHPSPALSASLPPPMRKTSHKAAEQKRRDSLKTTFDELRRLLPPIPLPSTPGTVNGYDEDGGANGTGGVAPAVSSSGAPGSTGGIIFGNAVKALLPGALPPRGPPKAGGEGPNKGVSKLQLLICGNEYIRTLNARVERRDEEIARLRKEVKKLRQFGQVLSVAAGIQVANSGFKGGGDGSGSSAGGGPGRGAGVGLSPMDVERLLEDLDLDLEIDLDRNIDAVEKMGGFATGTLTASGQRDDLLSSARSDFIMDEDPGEDDED